MENEKEEAIRVIDKRTLEIDTDQGTFEITLTDVVVYFAFEANDISSGLRRIGAILGDWRPIDYIAECCLEKFKEINLEALRSESKRYGLTPRF